MKEIKVDKSKLDIQNGKIVTKDLLNIIEEESIEIDSTDLENSNNLYLVLKDK